MRSPKQVAIMANSVRFIVHSTQKYCAFIIPSIKAIIRESVDSLCRDDADMPMPPYIRKACNPPTLHLLALLVAHCDPQVFLYLKTLTK